MYSTFLVITVSSMFGLYQVPLLKLYPLSLMVAMRNPALYTMEPMLQAELILKLTLQQILSLARSGSFLNYHYHEIHKTGGKDDICSKIMI